MVWAVTYLILSHLRFSCHRQWVTQRGLRVALKQRKTASSSSLCIIFSSIHGLPKQEWAVSNEGGRANNAGENSLVHALGEEEQLEEEGFKKGLWGLGLRVPSLQGNVLRQNVSYSLQTTHLFNPSAWMGGVGGMTEVFSVSSTNTMKSLSHESHPSCVCCHTSPAYLCSFV